MRHLFLFNKAFTGAARPCEKIADYVDLYPQTLLSQILSINEFLIRSLKLSKKMLIFPYSL